MRQAYATGRINQVTPQDPVYQLGEGRSCHAASPGRQPPQTPATRLSRTWGYCYKSLVRPWVSLSLKSLFQFLFHIFHFVRYASTLQTRVPKLLSGTPRTISVSIVRRSDGLVASLLRGKTTSAGYRVCVIVSLETLRCRVDEVGTTHYLSGAHAMELHRRTTVVRLGVSVLALTG